MCSPSQHSLNLPARRYLNCCQLEPSTWCAKSVHDIPGQRLSFEAVCTPIVTGTFSKGSHCPSPSPVTCRTSAFAWPGNDGTHPPVPHTSSSLSPTADSPIPQAHHQGGLIFNYFLSITNLYLLRCQILPSVAFITRCVVIFCIHPFFSIPIKPTFGPNSHNLCRTVLSDLGLSFLLLE